jgi:hypothetical protein
MNEELRVLREYKVTITIVTERVDSWGRPVRGQPPKKGGWRVYLWGDGGYETADVSPPDGRKFFASEEEAHEAGEDALYDHFGATYEPVDG